LLLCLFGFSISSLHVTGKSHVHVSPLWILTCFFIRRFLFIYSSIEINSLFYGFIFVSHDLLGCNLVFSNSVSTSCNRSFILIFFSFFFERINVLWLFSTRVFSFFFNFQVQANSIFSLIKYKKVVLTIFD
jgi:hypothetical protein